MKQTTFFLIISSLFFVSCTGDKKEQQKTEAVPADSLLLHNQVVALAQIQPEKKIISLFAEASGNVESVYYDIGDTIRKGTLIASLNSTVESAQLQQAKSKLATQHQVVSSNEASYASLAAKSQNSSLNNQRNADLYKSGAVTLQALDDSRFTAESGRKDAAAAAANVQQAKKRLSEYTADIAYAKSILAQKEIRAPYDGTILSLDIKVGKYFTASQSLGDFAPSGSLIAVTEVDELFSQSIKLGMQAVIKPQGKNNVIAKGRVILMSPYLSKKSLFSDDAANMEDRRVREVRVLLEDGADVLIGSRVDCIIKLK